MAAKRKTPQRTCVGCGTTGTKKGLLRIVRTPEGEVAVDPTGKRNGRGAYVCDAACLERALPAKVERALKVDLPPGAVEALKSEVQRLAPAGHGAGANDHG